VMKAHVAGPKPASSWMAATRTPCWGGIARNVAVGQAHEGGGRRRGGARPRGRRRGGTPDHCKSHERADTRKARRHPRRGCTQVGERLRPRGTPG
jgi:hypothetical protein